MYCKYTGIICHFTFFFGGAFDIRTLDFLVRPCKESIIYRLPYRNTKGLRAFWAPHRRVQPWSANKVRACPNGLKAWSLTCWRFTQHSRDTGVDQPAETFIEKQKFCYITTLLHYQGYILQLHYFHSYSYNIHSYNYEYIKFTKSR